MVQGKVPYLNPKISIILTSHNRGKLLEFAFQSILSQTYQDFEVIVVDDASTDPYTLEVLQKIEDSRFSLIRIEGTTIPKEGIKRVAVALNVGLARARGEWISYLCDDDFYYPHRLERYSKYFESGFDAIVGSAFFVSKDGKRVHQDTLRYRYPAGLGEVHQNLLSQISPANFICHDSICYRNRGMLWPEDLTEVPNDWRFWMQLCGAGYRFLKTNILEEEAVFPGIWKSGVTQEDILNGRKTMGKENTIRYAKNVSGKCQMVSANGTSKKVMPNERVDASLVSVTGANGTTVLMPGFSYDGEFTFPKIDRGTGKPVTKEKTVVTVEEKRLDEIMDQKAVDAMTPVEFEPIAKIEGSLVTRTEGDPKHPFDV